MVDDAGRPTKTEAAVYTFTSSMTGMAESLFGYSTEELNGLKRITLQPELGRTVAMQISDWAIDSFMIALDTSAKTVAFADSSAINGINVDTTVYEVTMRCAV